MTINQSLTFAIKKLSLSHIPSATLDAEILLLHILKRHSQLRVLPIRNVFFLHTSKKSNSKLNKSFIYTYPNHQLTFWQLYKFKQLVSQHAKNIPIAYLTGHKEFFGLNFKVNRHILIPRPETEILVEETLKQLSNINSQLSTKISTNKSSSKPQSNKLKTSEFYCDRNKIKKPKKTILIDIGTGSGCIPISILKNLQICSPKVLPPKSKNFGGLITTIATDISHQALKIAKQNASLHKIKNIKFIKSDLLKNIPDSLFTIHNSQIILTANLPYLRSKQTNPSIKYEPTQALYAGSDGLKYYRELLSQINPLITNFQLPITLFLEIDPFQTEPIKKLIQKYMPGYRIEIKKDLAGLNRIVKIFNS